MSKLIFLGLCYPLFIIFIMLILLNLVFVYAQPHSLQTPITSKVIPYNSSTSPLTSTSSYSVTNATVTFSKQILNGNTSKQ
jgi:hypothetical protein